MFSLDQIDSIEHQICIFFILAQLSSVLNLSKVSVQGPWVVKAQGAPFALTLSGSKQNPIMAAFLYRGIVTAAASLLPCALSPPGHWPSLCWMSR